MHIVSYLLNIIFWILQIILALYVVIPMILLISYGILNLFKVKTPFEKKAIITNKEFEFGIIITAHQETKFVIPLVDSLLKQVYKKFRVYVVADDCNVDELQFNDQRVVVLKPATPLNAKIKSINYGLDNFINKHDAVIIFDADNLIHPLFLDVMNKHFQKGYKVVQADFKPKNTDSTYARMDAIGDMFNFFVEREAKMRLGLSAAIWGSGVAVDYDLYREVQYKDFLGGFDKKLQAHLVENVDRIAFAPEAILYDEKITSGKSLEPQRTRWISSYFKYFSESKRLFLKGIRKMDFNLAYFGFTTLRPPLFIVLGLAFLVTIINYFVAPPLFIAWVLILFSFFLAFTLIVLIKGRRLVYIKTLFMLPLFVFNQVAALFKLKRAKKAFLKTEHTKLIFIDDLLQVNEKSFKR